MSKFNIGKASVLALTAVLAVTAFFLGKSLTSVSAHVCGGGCGTPTPTPTATPNCGTETYYFDNEGSNSRVSVDVHDSDEQIDVTGLNGWSVSSLWLDEDGGSTNYVNFGSGNKHDFNPHSFGDINKVKVEVTKDCPATDVCPNIEGNQAEIPAGYHFETIDDVRMCIVDTQESPTPVATPDPDVCKNIDGVQTGVPDGMHLDAAGINCVNFTPAGPPENPSNPPQGQVLGASTMAGTGSFAENLYLAIMAIGGIITTIGVKNYKKASKLA